MTTVDTFSAKASNAAIAATGGGAITAPIIGDTSSEIILYVLGLVISLIAFSHNEYHVNKSENFMQLITKASRYIVVGIFTFPSAYAYAGHTVWDYNAFKGLAGVVATLTIVVIMDAWVSGKVKKLGGDK